MHRTKVKVQEDALDANATIAQTNRADFDRAGVRVVNLMSAPGAGKTTLLERVVDSLDGVRVGVLEGDVQGSFDADRLARPDVPVVQLNTGKGFGGECHLDANMVRAAMGELPLEEIDLLIVENVGNLVCPAEFRIGEDVRAMVCSVTEGEDKPAKYPLMFRTCDLVIVNKVDLLPHLDYDMDRFLYHLDAVHPDVPRILTSARTGAGVDEWKAWLGEVAAGGGQAPGHHHAEDHDHDHNGHGEDETDEHVHVHTHADGLTHTHAHIHEGDHDHDHAEKVQTA
jgi:hydrogenase nickel incorporation protein HypB